MDELTKLKKELADVQKTKEIAKLKAQIKEAKNPDKFKKGAKAVGNFFRPRGNEKDSLKRLMDM